MVPRAGRWCLALGSFLLAQCGLLQTGLRALGLGPTSHDSPSLLPPKGWSTTGQVQKHWDQRQRARFPLFSPPVQSSVPYLFLPFWQIWGTPLSLDVSCHWGHRKGVCGASGNLSNPWAVKSLWPSMTPGTQRREVSKMKVTLNPTTDPWLAPTSVQQQQHIYLELQETPASFLLWTWCPQQIGKCLASELHSQQEVRNCTSTQPLLSPAWTLRIFHLKNYRWLKPLNNLALDAQIPMQKHKKCENTRQCDYSKSQELHGNGPYETPKNSKEWL
jgi:hypothetical protein